MVAVDFDGTIVENCYPEIGDEIPFACETLKALKNKGFHLILWTFRAGKPLEEAVDFCKGKGVEFYAVNKNYPEEQFNEEISRKIHADIYLDDRNLGGLPDWGEIYEMLCPEESNAFFYQRRRGFFSRLFNLK